MNRNLQEIVIGQGYCKEHGLTYNFVEGCPFCNAGKIIKKMDKIFNEILEQKRINKLYNLDLELWESF